MEAITRVSDVPRLMGYEMPVKDIFTEEKEREKRKGRYREQWPLFFYCCG
jgi:hypothetical protein